MALTVPATDYEAKVVPARDVLDKVATDVVHDLQPSVGGIGWWDGHVDFRRRVVLGEYLLDSLRGAVQALLDAALEAQTHRELLHADDTWVRGRWAAARETGASSTDDFLRAMERDPAATRRDRQIDTTASHVVSHLLRSLDCIAAALIIVGAVPQQVRRADWRDVVRLAEQCSNGSDTKKLDPRGTPGRQLQDELFATVLRVGEFGPTDWLEWLNATRNSMIHRGSRTSWYLLHGPRRRAQGLIRPFPVHPDLTDVEMMSRIPVGSTGDGMSSLRIVKHSPNILDGCVDSIVALVTALGHALDNCWTARREDPALLIQRGVQWQDLERMAELNFRGYGEAPEQIGHQMHIPLELGYRLEAAHVMDSQRARWHNDA